MISQQTQDFLLNNLDSYGIVLYTFRQNTCIPKF